PDAPYVACVPLLIRAPPRSTLVPYTTLFRSAAVSRAALAAANRACWSETRWEDLHRGAVTWEHSPGARWPLLFWPGFPRVSVYPDRKSTRLNSSHGSISYAVFCLKKKITSLQAQLSTYTFIPSTSSRPALPPSTCICNARTTLSSRRLDTRSA